jgi:hypothetical protein
MCILSVFGLAKNDRLIAEDDDLLDWHSADLNRPYGVSASAGQLLGDLAALDSESTLRRRVRHYARPDLPAIDEVGHLSYSNRHADLLFELVSRSLREQEHHDHHQSEMRRNRRDNASMSGGKTQLVKLEGSALQKKRCNGLPFLAEITFGDVPPSLPIPVAGIGRIALDAMQPSMDPRTLSARIVLGDLMSGLPFPAQSVPHGSE